MTNIHEKVHNPVDRPEPVCTYCAQPGILIPEYRERAGSEVNVVGWNDDTNEPVMADPPVEVTDDMVRDWIWANEGTINSHNGHFACTDCYIRIGQPSSPRGWVAP